MDEGKLTISRPTYGNEKRKISISVKDVNSRIRFLSVEIDLDKFSECLTGLSEVDCTIETRGLDKVGKELETRSFEFEIPQGSNRVELAKKIASLVSPDGWAPDLYFGSKKSFFTDDGVQYARTTLRRWADKA